MEDAIVRIPKSSENVDQNVIAEVTKQLQSLFLTNFVDLLNYDLLALVCLDKARLPFFFSYYIWTREIKKWLYRYLAWRINFQRILLIFGWTFRMELHLFTCSRLWFWFRQASFLLNEFLSKGFLFSSIIIIFFNLPHTRYYLIIGKKPIFCPSWIPFFSSIELISRKLSVDQGRNSTHIQTYSILGPLQVRPSFIVTWVANSPSWLENKLIYGTIIWGLIV